MGQVVRQTKPIQTPAGMADRFYSYDAVADTFRLMGYQDNFTDSSLNTAEWSVSGGSVSSSLSFATLDLNSGSTDAYLTRVPDTQGRTGDDVWGFDFAAKSFGSAPVSPTAWFAGRGTAVGANTYRAVLH